MGAWCLAWWEALLGDLGCLIDDCATIDDVDESAWQ